MQRLVYIELLLAAVFALTSCDSKPAEEEKGEQTETAETESNTTLKKSEIFEDVDVLRWAVDRVYRKVVIEEQKAFGVKDKIRKRWVRLEMIGMPPNELYPIGTETAYLGVLMKEPGTKDTLVVDFKLAWNPELFDPKYKRNGTFEVIDQRIRSINGAPRYRWVRDGDFYQEELLTTEDKEEAK